MKIYFILKTDESQEMENKLLSAAAYNNLCMSVCCYLTIFIIIKAAVIVFFLFVCLLVICPVVFDTESCESNPAFNSIYEKEDEPTYYMMLPDTKKSHKMQINKDRKLLLLKEANRKYKQKRKSNDFDQKVLPVGLSTPLNAESPLPPTVALTGTEPVPVVVLFVYFLLPLYSVLLSSSCTVVAPDWMPESVA